MYVLNDKFHHILISSYKKKQYLRYINNLFKIYLKINEAFRSLLHPQVKIIKEKSYIKMIYNVKINQIYITLVYSRDTISKKMRTLNVKLIIEARFEFCHIIGLKDLLFVSLMWCRCTYLPVNTKFSTFLSLNKRRLTNYVGEGTYLTGELTLAGSVIYRICNECYCIFLMSFIFQNSINADII